MNPEDKGQPDELESLRAAYEPLASAEPPDLVDQAVLNRARAAVAPPAGRRPWSFGWVHGLTTAGLVVLGLGLFLQLREPASPLPPDPAPTVLKEERSLMEPERRMRRVESSSLPAAAPASGDAPSRDDLAPTGHDAVSEKQSVNRALAEPAAAAEFDAARSEASSETEAATFMDDMVAESEDREESPEAWVERIRSLREAGDEAGAAAALAAFQERWPDYPLPEDLQP